MKKLTAFQKILLTFLALILFGTLLLSIPGASNTTVSLFDRLFVATSAVCVTGLTPVDTYSTWSTFGKTVIITLIQIGGLGLITLMMIMHMVSGKKIGLVERNTLKESLSSFQIGGIVKYVRFIIYTTLLFEISGMILLSASFHSITYGLFHSISAFCNAGFDLMGNFSSLTNYSNNFSVNAVICILIVVGGLGFFTLHDIYLYRFKYKKYTLQTKIILTMTFFLIVIPALYLFVVEYKTLPFNERLYSSFFQSITTRTAGFNTTDLSQLSEATQGIMILLMLIGASPGSCAGGFKNTTLFIFIICTLNILSNKQDTECFGRRIESFIVKKAIAIITVYFILFFTCGITISFIEGLPLLSCLFESASAIGTVGLTLGLTPSLSTFSKALLILEMIFGRVGGLNFLYATLRSKEKVLARYPKETINIG